jgi:hypothetical protein
MRTWSLVDDWVHLEFTRVDQPSTETHGATIEMVRAIIRIGWIAKVHHFTGTGTRRTNGFLLFDIYFCKFSHINLNYKWDRPDASSQPHVRATRYRQGSVCANVLLLIFAGIMTFYLAIGVPRKNLEIFSKRQNNYVKSLCDLTKNCRCKKILLSAVRQIRLTAHNRSSVAQAVRAAWASLRERVTRIH